VVIVVSVDVVIVLMVSKKKVTISWSGGKDSVFALYKILLSGEYDVVSLHTIFGSDTKRVGLHGVHEQLIESQAAQIGIPLTKLYLESSSDNRAFEKLTLEFYERCRSEKIEAVVFGDIFLEDLKIYRETLLKPSGLEPIFPLWQCSSDMLISDFVNTGFRTMICSADAKFFSKEIAGSVIDDKFITQLPSNVDPCGERGEVHSVVFDGPLFKKAVGFATGDVVLRWYDYDMLDADGHSVKQRSSFWFQDLLPRIAS
jgi:uncharacterized protein (TIGR00290 family)